MKGATVIPAIIDSLDSWRLAGLASWGPVVQVSSRAVSPSVVSPVHVVAVNDNQTERLNETKSMPVNTAQTSPLQNATPLELLAGEVSRCRRCEELARLRKNTVFGSGNPRARLVFLGEAPGADEDAQGVPFVGRAGQLLTDIITKGMGIAREDVYICNVLRCRPPGNRNPLPDEATNCREFLDRTLEIIAPEFVCCLGAVAAQNLLGTTDAIGKLRGRPHEYRGITVVCTYHPAYLLRNPAAKKDTWEDVQLLMKLMKD
ncbi:MAG: uracil-DNA glycosylase [Thermoguttaceae bacterium]